MAKRTQPDWKPPPLQERQTLKLFNSLTRKKEVFIPKDGNKVMWYSCGPTVYDASHMGHARSYISFDILRRVLSNYFGYQILYVMNITDIDDKIIKRAREQYLYESYKTEPREFEEYIVDAQKVMKFFEQKAQETTDPDKKNMMINTINNITSIIDSLKETFKSGDDAKYQACQKAFFEAVRDPVSQYLDKEKGFSVNDNKIFASLPRFWENEFHNDMKALNVLPPDVLTRVSEYVPQIVAYIEQIIKNGLAYESNGSVYFNVGEFDKKDKHHYAKLVPEAYGDTKQLQEGEGDLTEDSGEKKSPNDFALWKNSKPGEPSWESPWGLGRPGWHIECSAMASDVCGDSLDIHTGGVDLKFPHHDNELAQSEAYFDNPDWVSYFLHTGHLTIAGCKMSKSLKNFITIQEALKSNTAAQLRFAFLLHAWKETLDYSPNTMEMAVQYEKMLNEFFLTIKDSIRNGSGAGQGGCWTGPEAQLFSKLMSTQDLIHKALCDNIDTRSALELIRELVSATNIYLKSKSGAPNSPDAPSAVLLERIGLYVTDLMHIFGVIQGPRGGIGFPTSQSDVNFEQAVMPYLETIASFRRDVRDIGKELKASKLFQLCDSLRDDVLPNLGVRLEDLEDRSAVKLVPREVLLKEKEEKEQRLANEKAEKERIKLENLRLKEEKLAKKNKAKQNSKKDPPKEG